MKDNVLIGEMFNDFDLQWFRGGVQVVDVVNVMTEEDILISCHCGCDDVGLCFWCAPTVVNAPTDEAVPF